MIMTSTLLGSSTSDGQIRTVTQILGAVGREYLRVSLDRSGRARSIDEQHSENLAAATGRGVSLGEPYEDKSISASRYATKTRDGFAQLLADLERGRFGADELWLWESSRGSRKVGEWVTLIDLCERQRVRIHVTTHGRTYDPSNGRDRRSLLEDAVDSEYESGKISTRLKRANAANAAAGKPHGKTPFGYVRRYDERTKKLIAQEPEPAEAPVIRELFERVAAGHSFHGIARDFEARGVRTRTGKVFSPQHLRVLATTAVYAGLRTHDVEGRGPGRGHSPRAGMSGVEVVRGTWEPLISEAVWLSVQRLLSDPKRTTTRPGRAVHLLSNIALCDVCGGPLFARLASDGHAVATYQCRQGCVRVRKDELEVAAEVLMVGYLASNEVHAKIRAAEVDSDQLRSVRDALAAARSRLDELGDEAAAGRISIATVVRMEPKIIAEITELECRESELATPVPLRQFIDPSAHVEAQWNAMPMSAKREVCRILLTPGMMGELRVTQVPKGGPRRVQACDRIVLRTTLK